VGSAAAHRTTSASTMRRGMGAMSRSSSACARWMIGMSSRPSSRALRSRIRATVDHGQITSDRNTNAPGVPWSGSAGRAGTGVAVVAVIGSTRSIVAPIDVVVLTLLG
jgi:hypothetical protein